MTSTSRSVALVVGLLVLLVGLWVLHVTELGVGVGANLHRAAGYTQTVELFIKHRWLVYNPATDTIELRVRRDSPMATFYKESFLSADVEAFNQGDRYVFRVENGLLVGVDPHRHSLALPFSDPRLWRGTLTYRPEDGRRARLVGKDVEIELFEPRASLREQRAWPQVVLPPRRPGERESAEGEAVSVYGPRGLYFGRLHLVGDSVVVNHRNATNGGLISISGQEVPQGNRSRLDPGDVLKLEWTRVGAERRYVLLRNSIPLAAPVLSTWIWKNGTFRRAPEEPDPAFAGDVANALDWSLQRRKGSGYEIPRNMGYDDANVALTLGERLQAGAQRVLVRYCRQHFRKPRDASAPFRAAVSVMDAKTGELLALASYPVAEDLETFGGSTNARNRLLRNHNFTRLPIGSVAKVPLAAAILDHAPFLADLRIPGYSATQHERLLGITLAKPLEDHPVPLAEIDLERFLEHSSNRYAAVLLTLALGVDEAGHSLREPDPASPVPDRLQREDGFAISGRPFERRPRLDLNLRADPDDRSHVVAERMATDTLEHVKHAERLALLFDLWTSRKTDEGATATLAPRSAPGRGNDHIDTSIWLPLLNYLYPKGIPTSTSTGWAGYEPFVGVSPERENLAYNLISDYRAQYLSVILGGASSTFTTPKLCEMFSRLVTGKRIATTLTRRIQSGQVPIAGANRGVDIDALPMNPAVRQRLATALTLVAGGTGGTAKSLAPLLASYEKALAARGKTLGFFSKTGSPRNEMPVPSRFTRAVDALIRAGALHLDTNGRIHYRESGPVDMDGRRPSAALEALRANGDDLAILRRHRVSERAVLNVCDTYNDTDRRDRTQFQVDTRTGRLVRMATLPRIEATGGTYVFVMGTYDQKARLANHERGSSLPAVDVVANLPERALAVAINVEGQGKGPAVAVPLAGELLKEVLWKALETGW